MHDRLSYMLCFYLPCTELLFLIGGPYDAGTALAWTLPLWLLVVADGLGPKIKQRRTANPAQHFYTGILFCLAMLQLVNIGLMLNYASHLPWDSVATSLTSLTNLIAIRVLAGSSSACTGIIVGHELIHRRQRYLQMLGRLLLCTVCYEHFAIAHKSGHHRRIGKPHDITSARLGESFSTYWKRVYRGHFQYAWQFEQARLGITGNTFNRTNLYGNRILHGVLFELLMLVAITSYYGWVSLLIFLYQAIAAIRILETINYFQHWGLDEHNNKPGLAWVTDSWITRYALLNLSCHIDHHKHAGKHFQTLNYSNQGPKMPYGYFVMTLWIKIHNRSYQQMAVRELKNHADSNIEQHYPLKVAL